MAFNASEFQKQEPDLLEDAERIRNLDETTVSAQHGERVKEFSSSKTHDSGWEPDLKNNGKHRTRLTIASISGKLAPPFFNVMGKQEVPRWMNAMQEKHAVYTFG